MTATSTASATGTDRPPDVDGHAGDAVFVDPPLTDRFRHLRGSDGQDDLASQLYYWHTAITRPGSQPRFTLLRQVGRGAQGVVYQVFDHDCRRTIALKTFRGCRDAGRPLSRFIHEVQVTAQLTHPGIVPIHDFGVLANGTIFYTMPFIEGVSLAQRLDSPPLQRLAERLALVEQLLGMCATIAYAHRRGVVHRDLKPGNLMLSAFGTVQVLDWGLAKVVSGTDIAAITSLRSEAVDLDPSATATGSTLGTPGYMSPEQARGDGATVGPRSDIYALGVIFYEVLTGQSPYGANHGPGELLEQVITGTWVRLDRLVLPEPLPTRLVAVIHRALALDQRWRQADVETLICELRAALVVASAPAITAVPPPRRWTSGVIITAIALTAAALGWAMARWLG